MKESRWLLEEFLEGRCTKEELQAVKNLLDREKGRRMLDELIVQREMDEWMNPSQDDKSMREIVDTRWTDMQQHITNAKKSHRPLRIKTVLRWGSVAAVFAGVMILTGVMLRNNRDTGLPDRKEQIMPYAELTNLGGIPERYELPDGTQIWLAAGSTLTYPEQFSGERRDVELTGEAFFDVERDEQHPFTIRTGDMETRVLGTSFKITVFAGQEQEVAVATGKVSVSSNGKELALLTRGLQVRHNPGTGETTRAEIDTNMLEEWKSGALIFDELPMNLVVEQLKNRYGITIDFTDPKIGNRRVRGRFAAEEQAGTILELLGIVGNFTYKQSNENHYIIY